MAVIEPGRTDPEFDQQLRASLQGAKVVRSWYELGRASNRIPALWVWLVVPDQDASKPGADLVRLAREIEAQVRRTGRFWPYVFFRSESDQQALER